LPAGFASGGLDNNKPNDATQTGAYDVREDYRRANKLSIPFGPPTKRNPEGLDEVKDRESQGPDKVDHGPGPVYAWPVVIPKATSAVPTKRDKGITKHLLQTFGYPISDTQYQMIHRMDQQIMVEEMFDPERIMWLGAVLGTSQVQDSSNSCANLIRNQCASAIDYVSCPIDNFTVDPSNRWNKIRDKLFMPMAILFLLPGAMLAQVRVIVAAGMPIGGSDVNPFEGITRSIVAIFLIPATYLVVNYGLDLNNSLTFTIADEYSKIFPGQNMYKDALCCVIRAFPLRQAHENRNGVYKEVKPWEGNTDTPAGGLEERSLKVKEEDPCSGTFKSEEDRADEQAPFLSVGMRFVANTSNAVIAITWNILCAFQVVFIMYLWLVGPVVAALWVYPHEALRSAFPSWVEGVITLCFWALFWNTVVLLMACFKGVDSTGSIITSALLFLSTASVKSAFDFAGLVKDAGKSAADAVAGQLKQMAGHATPGVAGGGQGHGGGRGGGHGAPSRASHSVGGGSTGGGGHSSSVSGAAHSGVGSSSGHGAGTLGSLSGGGSASSSLHVSGTVSSSGSATGHSGASAGHGRMGSELGGRSISDSQHSSTTHSSNTFSGSSSGLSGDGSRAGMGGDFASPSAPPLINPGSAGNEVNINNLSSSSSSSLSMSSMNYDTSSNHFSSFNASNLTGTVDGMHGHYSAREAANLIGQGNLANMPREGAVMNREQAWANFSTAMKEVEMRNGKEGAFTPESQQRNDLMGAWKNMLEDADKNASPDGTMIGGMPDSLPGTNAGGNWNVPGNDMSAGGMPQGFGDVYNRVSNAVSEAGAAMSLPGAAGAGVPLNPQAVEGLSGLAKEMAQIGPQLNGMNPQVAGATMESWAQRADVYAQQLSQAPGQMSPDQYARMASDVQQAQMSLSQLQGYAQADQSAYYQQGYPQYQGGTVDPGYYSNNTGSYQGGYYDQSGNYQNASYQQGDPYANNQGYYPQQPVDYSGQQYYQQPQQVDPSQYYQQQADPNQYYPQQQQPDQGYYPQQQQSAPDMYIMPTNYGQQQPDYQSQAPSPDYSQAQLGYGQQQDGQPQWPQYQDPNQWDNPVPGGYVAMGSPENREPQYQQPDAPAEYQQGPSPEYGGAAGAAPQQYQQGQDYTQPMIMPPMGPANIQHPAGAQHPTGAQHPQGPQAQKPEQKSPEQRAKEAAKHAENPLKYISQAKGASKREMTEEEKRAMRRAMGLPEDDDETPLV
jgi:hypothetical protein